MRVCVCELNVAVAQLVSRFVPRRGAIFFELQFNIQANEISAYIIYAYHINYGFCFISCIRNILSLIDFYPQPRAFVSFGRVRVSHSMLLYRCVMRAVCVWVYRFCFGENQSEVSDTSVFWMCWLLLWYWYWMEIINWCSFCLPCLCALLGADVKIRQQCRFFVNRKFAYCFVRFAHSFPLDECDFVCDHVYLYIGRSLMFCRQIKVVFIDNGAQIKMEGKWAKWKKMTIWTNWFWLGAFSVDMYSVASQFAGIILQLDMQSIWREHVSGKSNTSLFIRFPMVMYFHVRNCKKL